MGCWIWWWWYPIFLLGCCFELYDAAESGAAVPALSADCIHTPLCIRFEVVMFPQKPWTFYLHLFIYLFIYLFAYLFIYLLFFSHTTQHGIVVLVVTTI